MRTHHKVCYIPDRPDHNLHAGPDWLEPFTCTVVLLPLHYCPVSSSRSKDRCTVCSSSELLGPRRSLLFLHEPETCTVGASLSTTPLHLSSILGVFHPARGPIWTSSVWDKAGLSKQGTDQHLDLPYLQGKSREDWNLQHFLFSFSGLHVCTGQEGHKTSHFCLRYVVCFFPVSDNWMFADKHSEPFWNVRNT